MTTTCRCIHWSTLAWRAYPHLSSGSILYLWCLWRSCTGAGRLLCSFCVSRLSSHLCLLHVHSWFPTNSFLIFKLVYLWLEHISSSICHEIQMIKTGTRWLPGNVRVTTRQEIAWETNRVTTTAETKEPWSCCKALLCKGTSCSFSLVCTVTSISPLMQGNESNTSHHLFLMCCCKCTWLGPFYRMLQFYEETLFIEQNKKRVEM